MLQWLDIRTLCIVLALLMPNLLGCEQAPSGSSPSSQDPSVQPPAPRDGIGQRLGNDVTMQPGRAREPAREALRSIVAFGNSLTAGAGIPAEESYPSQLQR